MVLNNISMSSSGCLWADIVVNGKFRVNEVHVLVYILVRPLESLGKGLVV